MAYLRTSEAAALLNITASTLRTWERRFGYPRPERSPGRHRQYARAEILALRDALQEGLSISSAISRARQGIGADTGTLAGALAAFDAARADAALDAALQLRPLETAIEDLLLPALDDLAQRHGSDSVAYAFALRWAGGWLRRARRLAGTSVAQFSVLVGDATAGDADPDAAALHAFELLASRAGARLLTLPVGATQGLGRAVDAIEPDLLVVVGRATSMDTIARWVYAARRASGPIEVALYRSAMEGGDLVTRRTHDLPRSPGAAVDALSRVLERRRTAEHHRVAEPEPEPAPEQRPAAEPVSSRERRGAVSR